MKKKRLKKVAAVVIVIFAVLAAVSIGYASNYYHSDKSVETYMSGTADVSVTEIKEGLFLDGSGTQQAIIFYPGAKVEYTAYLPLFMELAEQGTDCFLVKMPCNLAIFGVNKADRIMGKYDYENWYLAGHSLGGAMAASYASSNPGTLSGLILLASYPTKSLPSEDFRVLSLYGSEDKVLNMKKVDEGRQFMPEDYTEICIEGGNHAQFGSYGEQEGDGKATISGEEQRKQTAEAVLKIMEK